MGKLILINGKARAGKDYFARLLKEGLEFEGQKVQIMSFAEPIKDIIATTFSTTVENIDLYKNNKEDYSVQVEHHESEMLLEETNMRKILQQFGTNAMKKWFGDDVWSSLLNIKAYDAFENGIDFIIVPDFRFLVESNDSALQINIFNKDQKNTDKHKSENELDEHIFDVYVDNTGHKDLSGDVFKVLDLCL